jgi:HAMP domain-containing protein
MTTNIAGIVRRGTFVVFTAALLIGAMTFYLFFKAASMQHVEDEARALLKLAMASRNYTVEHITPLLEKLPEETFHPEGVPSFAAQALFKQFATAAGDYTYREAAINPTNPDDLASAFEVELIASFRADRSVKEIKDTRSVDGEPTFFIAQPIEITNQACLRCHSTPDAAPPALLAQYGTSNGFGWKMNEIVGAQVLSVPISREIRSIYELVAIFVFMLSLLFVVVSLVVALPLQKNVIQPLRHLAQVADRSSLRDDNVALPTKGAGEVQQLSLAISRLRTSLAVALKKSDPSE